MKSNKFNIAKTDILYSTKTRSIQISVQNSKIEVLLLVKMNQLLFAVLPSLFSTFMWNEDDQITKTSHQTQYEVRIVQIYIIIKFSNFSIIEK